MRQAGGGGECVLLDLLVAFLDERCKLDWHMNNRRLPLATGVYHNLLPWTDQFREWPVPVQVSGCWVGSGGRTEGRCNAKQFFNL